MFFKSHTTNHSVAEFSILNLEPCERGKFQKGRPRGLEKCKEKMSEFTGEMLPCEEGLKHEVDFYTPGLSFDQTLFACCVEWSTIGTEVTV